MPLTDDQRAMLQLLLQRGQSYADIGSLLGLDVEGVQSRAREALTEIGGQDPDRDVSLTDYLLGQADPIGRADAARQLQADGEARDLAERLVIQLRVLAPGADLPDLPGADSSATKRKDAPASAPQPSGEVADTAPRRRPFGELTSTLSRGQRQAIAGLFGAGILIVVGVLALAGVFDSGGGNNSSSSLTSGGGNSQTASSQGPPHADLKAQDGSNAAGVALIGRVRNVPFMRVKAFNLQPSPSGENYSIWLYGNNRTALRLSGTRVNKDGRLLVNLRIPTQVLQYIGNGTFTDVDVSLSSDSALAAEARQASKEKRLPRYTGKSVLRGRIVGGGAPGNSSSSSGQ